MMNCVHLRFPCLRSDWFLHSSVWSLLSAFFLALVLSATTVSTARLQLLASNNTCDKNDIRVSSALSRAVDSLDDCKGLCLEANQCVAISFAHEQNYCTVFSKFCDAPNRAMDLITVYRVIRQSNSTIANTPVVTSPTGDTETNSHTTIATTTEGTTPAVAQFASVDLTSYTSFLFDATTTSTATTTTETIVATTKPITYILVNTVLSTTTPHLTATTIARAGATSTTVNPTKAMISTPIVVQSSANDMKATGTVTMSITNPAANAVASAQAVDAPVTRAAISSIATATPIISQSPVNGMKATGTLSMDISTSSITTTTTTQIAETVSTLDDFTANSIVTSIANSHCDSLGRCLFCVVEDQFLSPCVTLVSHSIEQSDCEGVLDVNTANRLLSHMQKMLVARGLSSTGFQLSDSGGPRGRVRCGSVVATLSLVSTVAAEAVFNSLQQSPLEDIPFGNNKLSFVTTKDATTTTRNPLSMFDFLYWPWRQVDGAEPFISNATIMLAYASVLALVVLLPIVCFLCCRCCCFTSQCCCPHERLPLAMRLCSNNLTCLFRVAKCCCASNTLAPPETALPVLWRTDADFHAFGKSMYKYRTAAFGDEAATNESKSSAVVKPEAGTPVESISTLASGTLAVGTMRNNRSDFESSERKRRRDERRAKRANKGAQSTDTKSLELAVIHPPTEAAWYIGIEIGTRFVTIQFAPNSQEASVAKHARQYGLKLHSAVMHSKASPSGVALSYWKRLLVADSTRDRVSGTPWIRLFEFASSDATATARSIVPEALEAIGAAIAEHNLPAPTSQVAVSLPSYLMHLVTGSERERIWKWGMLVAGLRIPRVTVCTDTVCAIMTYATSPAANVHRRSSNLTADGIQQVFFLDVGYGFTSSAGCDIDMDHYRLHMLKEQCIPCACLDIVDNTFTYALQEVGKVREAVGLPTLAALAQREGPEVLVQSRERFQKELQSWAEELLAERFRSQSSQTPPQDTRAYLRQHKRLSLMEREPNDVHGDMSKQHSCTSITLTAGQFYKMNRKYFQSIIDSVCDTFRACDFRNPPIILVAGSGRPQVPLILSKMSARLKALRREIVAKHTPGAEVGVNQTVCLGDSARGASIIAMLRHQTSETVRHPAAGWATALRGMRGVVDVSVSPSRFDYTT